MFFIREGKKLSLSTSKNRMNNEEIKSKIFTIIAKLDNGSHSANQLQGADEALYELFIQREAEIVKTVEGVKSMTSNEDIRYAFDECIALITKK